MFGICNSCEKPLADAMSCPHCGARVIPDITETENFELLYGKFVYKKNGPYTVLVDNDGYSVYKDDKMIRPAKDRASAVRYFNKVST